MALRRNVERIAEGRRHPSFLGDQLIEEELGITIFYQSGKRRNGNKRKKTNTPLIATPDSLFLWGDPPRVNRAAPDLLQPRKERE